MGCHTFQRRTGSTTTTSTARTGRMTETCASTLGKGRSYPRASDRWETSSLLRGGRALPVGSWYVEANFSFCGIVSFNAFVVVLFYCSWVWHGAVSYHWEESKWCIDAGCIDADLINKCVKVTRAFHRLAVRLSGQTNEIFLWVQGQFCPLKTFLSSGFVHCREPSEHPGWGEAIARRAAVNQGKAD